MAGKRVQSEQANVDEHDQCTEANAKFAFERKSFEHVVPKEADKDDGEIEKVAMNILQDKWESGFAAIFAAAAFTDGTGGGIWKKSAVVRLAIVVAGGAKAEWSRED